MFRSNHFFLYLKEEVAEILKFKNKLQGIWGENTLKKVLWPDVHAQWTCLATGPGLLVLGLPKINSLLLLGFPFQGQRASGRFPI